MRLEAADKLPYLDQLAPLQESPLPNEQNVTTEIPDSDRLEKLIGKTIAKVTAPNAPAGFDPITDADIPLGIVFQRNIIRAAVHRLWDSGRYADIKITAELLKETTIELKIYIQPMLRISRLEIKGNSALDSDEIEKAIDYTPRRTILPDPDLLRSLRKKLLGLYHSIGYQEARAALSILTTETPGSVELLVEINEGLPERYTHISIEGLPEDIDRSIVGIKKGTIRNKQAIDSKLDKFITKLAENGYPDAETKPFSEQRLNQYDFAMTVPLVPGLRTEFRFKGNEHFSKRVLRDVLEDAGPVQTDPKSISKKEIMLARHLQTHGFLFAEVETQRACHYRQETIRQPLAMSCRKNAKSQTIIFNIDEGPYVEVVNVFFSGNEWFTDKELEEELFAYISEQNLNDEMFQPINTATIDGLGLSEKPTEGAPSKRALKATRFRRPWVYVPRQYSEATSHLTGVYQEQGFLSVKIDDTCDLTTRKPIEHRRTTFVPLKLRSDTAHEETPSSSCVFINRKKKQLIAFFSIDEGPRTTISELSFEGNTAFSSKELQRTSGMGVTKPYNEYQLKQGSRKLVEMYRSKGYMFAEVTFERFFSEDMQRARVVYTVKEGPQTRVGLVRIEGAETTSTNLIEQIITLERGVLITPEELEKSQMKLMDLGIFTGATIQMVTPEIPGPIKNIRVQVVEAKPQYLELRWGLATVEGVRTSFEYGYNNIAGLALGATLRARANYRLFFLGNEDFRDRYNDMTLSDQLEHHVLIGLGSPHLPGTKGLVGWGIDAIKERINKPGFSANRFTTFLRLNSRLAVGANHPHGLVLSGRTGLEYNLNIESGQELDNPYLQEYYRLPNGRTAFYVVGLNIALDLRDSPFNPKEGFFFSIGADWVYSLKFVKNDKRDSYNDDLEIPDEDSNLIRGQATASAYFPILNTDIVFAVSFTVGYIFHLHKDSVTWPDRYFYVGGVDTLRGFPEDSLVPQDLYEDWKSSLKQYGEDKDALLKSRGGESMFVTRAELRYPLAKGFLGAVFGEFGNLWRYRKRTRPILFKPTLKFNLRPVAGVGIRYQTPLGPISFDLGANLYQRHTELPFSWYISIGTAF